MKNERAWDIIIEQLYAQFWEMKELFINFSLTLRRIQFGDMEDLASGCGFRR